MGMAAMEDPTKGGTLLHMTSAISRPGTGKLLPYGETWGEGGMRKGRREGGYPGSISCEGQYPMVCMVCCRASALSYEHCPRQYEQSSAADDV